MEKLILIKYGELTTKKDNRKEFINILYNNLHNKIKEYDAKIIKEYSRMYIEFDETYQKQILEILHNTFGIHAFNLAYKTNSKEEDIKEQ